MDRPNTFGSYEFPGWVPEHTRDIIRNFWGQMGRTHKDWLANPSTQGISEQSHHGPNPNGFGVPPNFATADYTLRDYAASKKVGYDVCVVVRGRYIHRWNDMGSLVDDNGKDWTVSTCDRWVRVFQDEAERDRVLQSASTSH